MTGPISKLDRLRSEFGKIESIRNRQLESRANATPAVEQDYQDALRALRNAEQEALKDVAR